MRRASTGDAAAVDVREEECFALLVVGHASRFARRATMPATCASGSSEHGRFTPLPHTRTVMPMVSESGRGSSEMGERRSEGGRVPTNRCFDATLHQRTHGLLVCVAPVYSDLSVANWTIRVRPSPHRTGCARPWPSRAWDAPSCRYAAPLSLSLFLPLQNTQRPPHLRKTAL